MLLQILIHTKNVHRTRSSILPDSSITKNGVHNVLDILEVKITMGHPV